MSLNYPWNKYEKQIFLKRLLKIQTHLSKKSSTKNQFNLNNHKWDTSLYNNISNNNFRPTEKFMDMIYRYNYKPKPKLIRIKGKYYKVDNKTYLKVHKNQWLIIDSLYEHGSNKYYYSKKQYKYSEHAGLLDFNKGILSKIIIYGNTTQINKEMDEIFLPGSLNDAPLYEYMFHTHPASPYPGGRVDKGMIYELPSIGDIFNFIDNHNKGKTQGSIIVAPEGVYVIAGIKGGLKSIKVNEDALYEGYIALVSEIQFEVIENYDLWEFKDAVSPSLSPPVSPSLSPPIQLDVFFNEIVKDLDKYIDKINKLLNKFKLKLLFYPRIKDIPTNRWIIDTIYLPVIPIEIK